MTETATAPATTTPATKPWYASLTFWGAVIAVVSGTVSYVTGQIDQNFHTAISASPAVTTVTSILGFIITIIGRFNATKTLTK